MYCREFDDRDLRIAEPKLNGGNRGKEKSAGKSTA
jgi:hypothetical protein